jgi:peptidoglycan/LPS O-acetylase OafA/YrhL
MKLNSLEAGRGIAAFSVVLFHLNAAAYWKHLPTFAFLEVFIHGVDFFFVISGFIIFYVHRGDIGRPQAAHAFAAKRFIRLYPILWLVVLATAALYTVGHKAFDVRQIPTSLLLYPSLLGPIPDVVWTLRHELMFYLAFLVLILHRRAGIALFAGWTLAVLVQMGLVLAGRPVGGIAAFFLSSYEIDFLLGAAVAWNAARIRPGAGLLAAGVVLVAGALWLGERWGIGRSSLADYTSFGATWWVVVLGLCFAVLLAGMLAIETKVRVPGWLSALGASSYALYLVHVPIEQAIVGFAARHPPALVLMVVVPVAAGLALHYGFERPVSRWLRARLLPARRVPVLVG